MFPLWLIPICPLIGALINGVVSAMTARNRQAPSVGMVSFVAVAASALSFLIVIGATVTLGKGMPMLAQHGWEWLPLAGGWLSFGLHFDRLSAVMLLFITGIGTLIHIYSIGYMREDRGFARFMAYLNLFMASMITLVLGSSLPATFLGWEGVGLCSYLLVGFWHQDQANVTAANKAFIMNRIGDLGFLLGAFFLIAAMGDHASLDYTAISEFFRSEAGVKLAGSGLVVAACALFFVGCTGKSAQIPLLTWLPDAMAGPTPVSALIHAATMVTSGIYLCARLCDVFVLAGWVMPLIMVIGCATAVYGAIAGLVQWDIKKVLAYSTVSQLGFMFMAVGAGAFDVALFHVFTHACFKAVLFLGAGSVIHALHHEQDMRRMGGLSKLLPLTYSSMWFGWYAIIGLPFGSGFMSKDMILERLWDAHTVLAGVEIGKIVCIVAVLTALLTAVYMTRMMYLVFWSKSRMSDDTRAHVHEVPLVMSGPVLLLGFAAMCAGTVWFGAVPELNIFGHYLSRVLGPAQAMLAPVVEGGEGAAGEAAHHASWTVMIAIGLGVSLITAGLGWVIARLFYRNGPRDAEVKPLSGFAATWTHGLDAIYHALFVTPLRLIAWALARLVDQALLGGMIRSLGSACGYLGDGYLWLQQGRLRISLIFSLIGAGALLIYLTLGKGF